MTTLKELNKLAKECEICALKDSKSINQHLRECNTCGEYHEKAEVFNQTVSEVRKIASRSEDERRHAIHKKLSDIANMDEDMRIDAMIGLLDSTAILPEEDRIKLIRARADVLADFPKYTRNIVMKTMGDIMKDWDKDRKRTEHSALTKATEDYPVLKKMMVRNMFDRMME